MDLRATFSDALEGRDIQSPIKTIVCDVFGTLIYTPDMINKPLLNFLKQSRQEGADIYIASSDPALALASLEKAGIEHALIEKGIFSKTELMEKLYQEGRPYIAIDDDAGLLWFDAAISLQPDDPVIQKATTQQNEFRLAG